MNSQPDRQPIPADLESDPEATRSMARFGLHAGTCLQQLSGALEILSHLIFLANGSIDEPAKLREYLKEAEQQAQVLVRGHVELLEAYPASRPQE